MTTIAPVDDLDMFGDDALFNLPPEMMNIFEYLDDSAIPSVFSGSAPVLEQPTKDDDTDSLFGDADHDEAEDNTFTEADEVVDNEFDKLVKQFMAEPESTIAVDTTASFQLAIPTAALQPAVVPVVEIAPVPAHPFGNLALPTSVFQSTPAITGELDFSALFGLDFNPDPLEHALAPSLAFPLPPANYQPATPVQATIPVPPVASPDSPVELINDPLVGLRPINAPSGLDSLSSPAGLDLLSAPAKPSNVGPARKFRSIEQLQSQKKPYSREPRKPRVATNEARAERARQAEACNRIRVPDKHACKPCREAGVPCYTRNRAGNSRAPCECCRGKDLCEWRLIDGWGQEDTETGWQKEERLERERQRAQAEAEAQAAAATEAAAEEAARLAAAENARAERAKEEMEAYLNATHAQAEITAAHAYAESERIKNVIASSARYSSTGPVRSTFNHRATPYARSAPRKLTRAEFEEKENRAATVVSSSIKPSSTQRVPFGQVQHTNVQPASGHYDREAAYASRPAQSASGYSNRGTLSAAPQTSASGSSNHGTVRRQTAQHRVEPYARPANSHSRTSSSSHSHARTQSVSTPSASSQHVRTPSAELFQPAPQSILAPAFHAAVEHLQSYYNPATAENDFRAAYAASHAKLTGQVPSAGLTALAFGYWGTLQA